MLVASDRSCGTSTTRGRPNHDAYQPGRGEHQIDVKTLFVQNDPAYGTERAHNGLRLTYALTKRDGEALRVFLLADAVTCALTKASVSKGS
jgi:hypothetical protein